MNNRIICSTGTYIGPQNNFDYRLIPVYCKELECDSLELMMLRVWYPYLTDVQKFLSDCGAVFDVIHSDKEIGVLLSLGTEEDTAEAERLFELSCQTGQAVGAKKLVLHLWGGKGTDAHIEYNVSRLGYLFDTAEKYDLKVLTENIPCGVHDPLSNWSVIRKEYPDARFIFDTRFGAFHRQLSQVFDDGWYDRKNICHMHISDFAGQPGEFHRLRPIPMPREGTIGSDHFDSFFAHLKIVYSDSITLESPAINDDGSVDISVLNNALDYIRKSTR